MWEKKTHPWDYVVRGSDSVFHRRIGVPRRESLFGHTVRRHRHSRSDDNENFQPQKWSHLAPLRLRRVGLRHGRMLHLSYRHLQNEASGETGWRSKVKNLFCLAVLALDGDVVHKGLGEKSMAYQGIRLENICTTFTRPVTGAVALKWIIHSELNVTKRPTDGLTNIPNVFPESAACRCFKSVLSMELVPLKFLIFYPDSGAGVRKCLIRVASSRAVPWNVACHNEHRARWGLPRSLLRHQARHLPPGYLWHHQVWRLLQTQVTHHGQR